MSKENARSNSILMKKISETKEKFMQAILNLFNQYLSHLKDCESRQIQDGKSGKCTCGLDEVTSYFYGDK